MILILLICFIIWWLSNIIYSVWLGPLRDIPSPWLFQLFPLLYDVSMGWGNSPFVLQDLHLQYGPVFRVGWTKVIFVDPQAATAIYGSYKCQKGRLYEGFKYFGDNLLSMQDLSKHKERKKMMTPAFTADKIKAMANNIINVGVQPLLRNLTEASKTQATINLYQQFHVFSWDVMGALGFGQSFKMLDNPNHPAVTWLQSVATYAIVTFALPFLKRFTIPNGEKLRQFSQGLLDEYYNQPNKPPSLLDHFTAGPHALSRDDVLAEANLLLFAGTDTTSNAMTFLFHFLLQNESILNRLKQECQQKTWSEIIELSPQQLNTIFPYLEACIKESLRLRPPVAGTLLRDVPSTGLTINKIFLPPQTQVAVAILPLHTSPDLWDQPYTFLPDRWLNSPPSGYFIPFILGPRGCIGKDLALYEMRIVTLGILHHVHLNWVPQPFPITAQPILRPTNHELLVRVSPL